jgi:fumarate reductase flavoprotein subunit
MRDALYIGGPGSTGDAIGWGVQLGGVTEFMDAYQAHGCVSAEDGAMVPYSITTSGGIHVNRFGERFADETNNVSKHALEVMHQPGGVAYLIFDDSSREIGLRFEGYRSLEVGGQVLSGSDAESLAKALGIDAPGLALTVAECQAAAAGGGDQFGRLSFAPFTSRLYGVRVTAALFHTQGGLKVDRNARVARGAGGVIPGLYAGGGAAAGISGHGPGGYLPGAGLLTAIAYGYLAGKHASAAQGNRPPG